MLGREFAQQMQRTVKTWNLQRLVIQPWNNAQLVRQSQLNLNDIEIFSQTFFYFSKTEDTALGLFGVFVMPLVKMKSELRPGWVIIQLLNRNIT